MNICSNCGSDKTGFSGNGYPSWFRYKDGYICKKCYNKLIYSPRYYKYNSDKVKTKTRKRGLKRIRFKNNRFYLKENPRTGVCSLCRKQGLTHIHHINYHSKDILKDTVELRASCHMKETMRLSKEVT